MLLGAAFNATTVASAVALKLSLKTVPCNITLTLKLHFVSTPELQWSNWRATQFSNVE